jgi:NADPH-dependent glutamate synthase beta subunit-like oxidoreductase
MANFKYVDAVSVEEAASILKEYGKKARVIAGGTDILGEVKDDILPDFPEVIVNIKSIPGLDYIKVKNKKLSIGAATRLEDIARDPLIKEKYGLLAEAARRTASPHIREMGTIAGNICQSNRCWYYWVQNNRFNCLRKGGGHCYALTGDARYHSIFGAAKVDVTPCAAKCPDNVDIPSYFSKIREGDLSGAARKLIEHNPLPAVTGRVCPHFCESDCNRGIYDEAVAIRCVERFMGDYILKNQKASYPSPHRENHKRIAIVGSGPAGLSAAYYLRQLGYSITVFERMAEAGGVLTYGIPSYRLPKAIVKKQVKAFEKIGITFKTGVTVGQDIQLKDLTSSFDAIFLACGTWKEREMGIRGEEHLLSGTGFLAAVNSGHTEIPGHRVAVIGAGNVAIDVARTLRRLGAEPVIVYRRTRAEMPALKEEVEKAEEEGIAIHFLTSPVEVSKKGRAKLLKCERMKLGPADATGRPRPVAVRGSEFVTEYDAVFKAIGEDPDVSFIPAGFLKKARLQVDASSGSIGQNLFAGGDFVSGSSTVVEAIAAGRTAAGSIDLFLGGTGISDKCECGQAEKAPLRLDSSYLRKTLRVRPAELTAEDRVKNIHNEDVAGLDLKAINMESGRCFNCGCVAVNPSDIAPALIVLDAKIRTSQRLIEAEKFFAVEGDKSTVLADDEIVLEIIIPEPGSDTRFNFTKFALRKSIDFPVVNCAAAVQTEKGTVKASRICLNAVYNQPYRVTGAENYIQGKKITESVAAAAAEIGLKEAFPLINNRYKIQIARTLVKRAILACTWTGISPSWHKAAR